MAKRGPILIVEDDPDDQELLRDIFGTLKVSNELVFFSNGMEALEYLYQTELQPFLILCDINMPVINGIELRKKISEDDYLRRKSIPFIFLSTSANPLVVKEAYNLTVQGFFQKQHSLTEATKELRMIVEYWRTCRHPNI